MLKIILKFYFFSENELSCIHFDLVILDIIQRQVTLRMFGSCFKKRKHKKKFDFKEKKKNMKTCRTIKKQKNMLFFKTYLIIFTCFLRDVLKNKTL